MSQPEKISMNQIRHEVIGKMTFSTVPDLMNEAKDKFKLTDTEIVFDLDKVKHSDSAGLALMLEWCRLAKLTKKKIKFVNAAEQVINLTEVSGLSNILRFSVE